MVSIDPITSITMSSLSRVNVAPVPPIKAQGSYCALCSPLICIHRPPSVSICVWLT